MKKRKPEVTSARVAKIAARILSVEGEHPEMANVLVYIHPFSKGRLAWFRWADIQAVAASALTQTPNKKPKLRPYTVDASTIPEMGETFDPPKRKAKRKAKRK